MKVLVSSLAILFSASAAIAGPEIIGGTPYTIDAGTASVSGAGKVLKVSNLPVVANGTTTYFNLDFDIKVLADGSVGAQVIGLSAATGPAASGISSTQNLQPGRYAHTADANCVYVLSEPAVDGNGRRVYGFSPAAGAACSFNKVGSFFNSLTSIQAATGPTAGHPLVDSQYTASLPSLGAWGTACSSASYPQVLAQTGSQLTVTCYSASRSSAAIPYGSPATFSKL